MVAQLDRVTDYESVGRGFESLPSHQERPEHNVFWSFFFCAWKGLEQHGRAAGEANNSPVGCCLVRGDHRPGMSAVEAVDRKISWLFCFVSHGCTVGVIHVRLCRALYCIAIGFRCPLVLAALLEQPIHQELFHRHCGRRPSTATPIRASFCRRTGACRSLSQPLFRISRNQGVTHWTLQAKSCANERSAALWILPGRALENGVP